MTQQPHTEPLDDNRASYASDRRAPRRARHARRSDGWMWGAVLIAVGVFLLLNNTEMINVGLHNWWALFILIPAIGGFTTAVNQYRAAGYWSAQVTGSLLSAVVITLVALTFLLGWDWSKIWPIFLITGGVAALIGALGQRRDEFEDED